MTSAVENEVLAAAQDIAPSAPIVQAAEAAITTIASPSVSQIVADFELAVELVKEFKTKLAGLHPSLINIIKALF